MLIDEINKRGLNIAVCGIPKTIDNDIPLIDKSFGYETSCEYANKIIEAANVEAECIPNGVGLVKVMGRDSGFIAMNASLANRDVNLCLIPEAKFMIEGEYGICSQIIKRLKIKHHAVIVVAEGADDGALDIKFEKDENSKDAGGHIKHSDIGTYLQKRLTSYAKENGVEINVKYIDPTYAI